VAEIKKKIEVISNWLEYELETDIIEPPVLKVRLSPLTDMEYIESYDVPAGEIKPLTKIIISRILSAVNDWDLTLKGKKIQVTEENKRKYLVILLGTKVKGKGKGLLGFELLNYASNWDNFLKN